MKRLLFLAFFIFQNAQAENLGLSEAYENEIIEEVKSVFQTKGIEEKVERPICATSIFLEIKANWDRFSPKAKAILKPYTERPTFNFPEHTYDTPPGHFKIHYVTEGDSTVPNEDWVHTCGEVLEHVWDTECNVLDYREPPSDGWYPDSNGGDGRYDVYLLGLSLLFLGYTQGEYFFPPQSLSATSYIVLDNDYLNYGSIHSQIEWLEVTFAHEFFHAIQMGYDATECEYVDQRPKFYWMEMSSTWMEDMVYDNVNDYLSYLPSFFNHPEWSLKTFGVPLVDPRDEVLHPYGSCIWPIFLSERFDTLIIKDIWEKCAEKEGDNVLEATDAVLRTGARGSTFEDAFREFTVWNYFTKERARPDTFYSEGDLFPQVKVDSLFHYHILTDSVFQPAGPDFPHSLSSNYVVFIPDPDLKGGMRIEFIGHTGDYKVSVVRYKSYPHSPFITDVIGVAKVYDWTLYNEIVLIPAVVTRSPDNIWGYEYSAFYDSTLQGESPLPERDEILQNYPNPFVIETESNRTYFPFVLSSPTRVRVDIFTLGGERVKTIIPKYDPILSRERYVEESALRYLEMFWDGKNEEGKYVSSGIYLYRFRTDRNTEIMKMAVIR